MPLTRLMWPLRRRIVGRTPQTPALRRASAIRPRVRTAGCRSSAWPDRETRTRVSRSRVKVLANAAGLAALTDHDRQSSGIGLEVAESREHGRGRFRSPAGQPGIAVGGIADQRQVVGDRIGRHAELRDDARFVADDVRSRRSNCTTRVPRTHCARSLSGVQMITRSTARVRRSHVAAPAASASSASNSTIGQTATPSAIKRLLEERELREQVRLDAGAGLVAGPQTVAERLDDVIGGDADVRRAAVDHAEHRADDAADGGDFAAVARRAPTAARSSGGRARRCRRSGRCP